MASVNDRLDIYLILHNLHWDWNRYNTMYKEVLISRYFCWERKYLVCVYFIVPP